MLFHLTVKAKTDLKGIGCYTQNKWGREQRNHYLHQLDEAFHLLAQDSNKGRDCAEIREGYQQYRIGKHVIFYRLTDPQHIEIVRILHERMNFENNSPTIDSPFF